MAEHKSKYGAIAELKHARPAPQADMVVEEASGVRLLPEKTKRQGKRSDPTWKQYSVLLKKETHKQAVRILQEKHEGYDISELMEALLEQWVNSK